MKCAACGYEYINNGRWIDVISRYKSGKRKGEIKSVDKEWLDTSTGHAPFKEISFLKEVDDLVIKEDYYVDTVTLCVCPECSTVMVK